jgi:hypothetical protein
LIRLTTTLLVAEAGSVLGRMTEGNWQHDFINQKPPKDAKVLIAWQDCRPAIEAPPHALVRKRISLKWKVVLYIKPAMMSHMPD